MLPVTTTVTDVTGDDVEKSFTLDQNGFQFRGRGEDPKGIFRRVRGIPSGSVSASFLLFGSATCICICLDGVRVP